MLIIYNVLSFLATNIDKKIALWIYEANLQTESPADDKKCLQNESIVVYRGSR